jgi:hypothetical protein
MPRFAIYYLPPAHSPFYRLGTSILGYDVRREQASYTDNFIRGQIIDFDESFVRLPKPHGLHCTILTPQPCRGGDLGAVCETIERILNCFSGETAFTMQAQGELLHFWGEKREIVVLRYEANPAFLILHSLLVASLAKFSETVQSNIEEPLHHAWRSKYFRNAFIFDEFVPHFTLLYPYKGHEHAALEGVLQGIFRSFTSHRVDSLCLMIQENPGENWRIYREFHRVDYPQKR